jgi:hypothetical protein
MKHASTATSTTGFALLLTFCNNGDVTFSQNRDENFVGTTEGSTLSNETSYHKSNLV